MSVRRASEERQRSVRGASEERLLDSCLDLCEVLGNPFSIYKWCVKEMLGRTGTGWSGICRKNGEKPMGQYEPISGHNLVSSSAQGVGHQFRKCLIVWSVGHQHNYWLLHQMERLVFSGHTILMVLYQYCQADVLCFAILPNFPYYHLQL